MDFTYLMFLNTIFTVVPTLTVGVFDFDIEAELSLMVPQIYLRGIQQKSFSSEKYFVYVGHAIYQSLVCYFGTQFLFDGAVASDGTTADIVTIGTTTATVGILVINLYSIGNWYSWTWVTFFSLFISMGSWVLYLYLYSSSPDSATYGIQTYLASPLFYSIVIILTIIALFPRMLLKYIQQLTKPNDTDLLQEFQKYTYKTNKDVGDAVSYMTSTHTAIPHQPTTEKQPLPNRKSVTKMLPISDGFEQKKSENASSMSIEKLKVVKEIPAIETKPLRDEQFSSSREVLDLKESHNEGLDTSRSRENRNISSPAKKSGIKLGFENVVKKFKKNQISDKPKLGGSASIMYMNGDDVKLNTGYAFSHATGMEDIITPYRTTFGNDDDDLFKTSRKESEPPVPTTRFRIFSQSIQGVFKRNRTGSALYRGDEDLVASPLQSSPQQSSSQHSSSPHESHAGSAKNISKAEDINRNVIEEKHEIDEDMLSPDGYQNP
jgi:phospholipid-translocating ATPase